LCFTWCPFWVLCVHSRFKHCLETLPHDHFAFTSFLLPFRMVKSSFSHGMCGENELVNVSKTLPKMVHKWHPKFTEKPQQYTPKLTPSLFASFLASLRHSTLVFLHFSSFSSICELPFGSSNGFKIDLLRRRSIPDRSPIAATATIEKSTVDLHFPLVLLFCRFSTFFFFSYHFHSSVLDSSFLRCSPCEMTVFRFIPSLPFPTFFILFGCSKASFWHAFLEPPQHRFGNNVYSIWSFSVFLSTHPS